MNLIRGLRRLAALPLRRKKTLHSISIPLCPVYPGRPHRTVARIELAAKSRTTSSKRDHRTLGFRFRSSRLQVPEWAGWRAHVELAAKHYTNFPESWRGAAAKFTGRWSEEVRAIRNEAPTRRRGKEQLLRRWHRIYPKGAQSCLRERPAAAEAHGDPTGQVVSPCHSSSPGPSASVRSWRACRARLRAMLRIV